MIDRLRASLTRAERERDEAIAKLAGAELEILRQRDLLKICEQAVDSLNGIKPKYEQATALLRETRSVVDTWLAIAEAHGLGHGLWSR